MLTAHEQTARRFFMALLFVTTVLLALVVRPIGEALFMAVVTAAVLAPWHEKLVSRLGGRRNAAAGIVVFGVVVVVLGPLVMLASFLVKEGSEALRFVAEAMRGEAMTALLGKLPVSMAKLASRGVDQLADINQTIASHLEAQGGKAVATLISAAAATGSLLLGLAASLIALFFMLAEGHELVTWLDHISPLRRGQTRELLAEVKKVSFSVIVSALITAAVQAVAALLGYLITGVPHPVFFAALTFFVAFIPAIGAASVCLFAAGILYVTGHPYWALSLTIWGLAVVGLVDNVIKPLLIRAGMQMRGAVVFFSLIGGLEAFGAVGLVIGPLVVAVFLTLVRIYVRDFKPPDDPNDPV